MSQTDEKLVDLMIRTGAFRYSPDKPFKLVSGESSPFYFDLKVLCGDPEGINAVAGAFYARIRQIPGIRSVGGLAAGSISIATAVSQHSYLENRKDSASPLIESFFVRKEAKQHGTAKRIEGRIDSPAVIIDDVITSGMSALAAVDAVKRAGYECRCLMSVIFRGSAEQRKKIEETTELQYIFEKDQLIKQAKDKLKT